MFDGNSGGPVFMADPRPRPGSAEGAYFVAGVLTKQVESKGDRLEIGVVTHAKHVREAIALLDRPIIVPTTVAAKPQPVGVQPPTTTTTASSSTAPVERP